MEVTEVSADLSEAYATSCMGADLVKPFPIGELHRGTMHVLQAWQQKFHPVIRKRHSKRRGGKKR